MGATHAENIRSPTLRLTKTQRLELNNPNLDSSDQRTDFQWSNVHCLCFLAHACLFFLLVSFSSCVFDHKGLIHTVSSEQLMLMCLLLELCEAFIWALICEGGN